MSKLPWGGIETSSEHEPDDGWTRLTTIYEYLEDGQPLSPYLAEWLGSAIRFSNKDPNDFLLRLNLKRPKGRPSTKSHDWMGWAERVINYEDTGEKPEEAISKVLTEMTQNSDNEEQKISRTTLQEWRDKYKEAQRCE